MLPVLFLLVLLAAIELSIETFALLTILFCVVAGLTEPVGQSHSINNKRRPVDAPGAAIRKIDGKTHTTPATYI